MEYGIVPNVTLLWNVLLGDYQAWVKCLQDALGSDQEHNYRLLGGSWDLTTELRSV